jgi:hypothetical protein
VKCIFKQSLVSTLTIKFPNISLFPAVCVCVWVCVCVCVWVCVCVCVWCVCVWGVCVCVCVCVCVERLGGTSIHFVLLQLPEAQCHHTRHPSTFLLR